MLGWVPWTLACFPSVFAWQLWAASGRKPLLWCIYILPDVAPWQGYMSCDGNSCPRCKKTVFLLQEQRRGWLMHVDIIAASWFLVILGWKPNPHVGLVTFCDANAFCMNLPWACIRHCKEWTAVYLTALFGDFLNSEHKEACVPKQVWHHKWGFSLLHSESALVIQFIIPLTKSDVSGSLRLPKIIMLFFAVLSTNILSHFVGHRIYLSICISKHILKSFFIILKD